MKKRVLFFLLVFFTSCSALANEKPLLHFVQISDTHLQKNYARDAERLLGSSEKLLKDAVNQINKIENLDFVLSTGDQVDVPDEALIEK